MADEAEQRIYEVARHDEKDQVATLRELVDQAMTDLEKIQNRESAFAGVPTGFRDVDTLLSGLQAGNLIIVAARPGVGKSSFVTNLARNVAVDAGPAGRDVLPRDVAVGDRHAPALRARRACRGTRSATSGSAAEDWSRIAQAADTLHDAPLFIVDSGNVTLVDIRAKARRLAAPRAGSA